MQVLSVTANLVPVEQLFSTGSLKMRSHRACTGAYIFSALHCISYYNLIMMLLRARDNNIQSFAYTWLHKGNQNEFLKHSKIKWLDEGLEPPTSELPVHCSTT